MCTYKCNILFLQMGGKKRNILKFLFSKLVQNQLSMASLQIISSSMVAECLKMQLHRSLPRFHGNACFCPQLLSLSVSHRGMGGCLHKGRIQHCSDRSCPVHRRLCLRTSWFTAWGKATGGTQHKHKELHLENTIYSRDLMLKDKNTQILKDQRQVQRWF